MNSLREPNTSIFKQKSNKHRKTPKKCRPPKYIDISKFHTENVEHMGNMFRGCRALEKLNVSNFNTKKVRMNLVH